MQFPALIAAISASLVAAFADWTLTAARIPRAVRGAEILAWSAMHVFAAFAIVGVVLGVVGEIAVRLARRIPVVRASVRRALGNPRRWFESGPDVTALFARTALALTPLVVVVFVIASRVLRGKTHSHHGLSPRALLLVAFASAASITFVVFVPLSDVVKRATRRIVPGAAVSAYLAMLAVAAIVLVATHPPPGPRVDLELLGALLGFMVANVAALIWQYRRDTQLPRWLVGSVATVMSVAIATSALMLGSQQSVLSTLLIRSVGSRRIVPMLQRSFDRDHDGYGVLFGGGDCDDRDPRIHPGARDVPGNGIDESCTGRDSHAGSEHDDHAMVRVADATALRPPSILFVSIDTMRPDHMGAYGYARNTTPNLSRFVARGARFTTAYALAPQSVRSFTSIFTGRTPFSVEWTWGEDPHFPAVSPRNTTLAELLRARGYTTAAFTNTSYFSLTDGFFQGFDHVEEGHGFEDDAKRTVRLARRWLDEQNRNDAPSFTWVHLIDPHEPYIDHEHPVDFGHEPIDRYDEEIAYADEALEPVFEAAERMEGPSRRLVTFVFGDHGEAFGEHGRLYHSQDVHEEVLRVPLMIRGPGIAPGVRSSLVTLMDIFATVANYTGIDVDTAPRSHSLVSLLSSPQDLAPFALRSDTVAEVIPGGERASGAIALIAPPWKIVHDIGGGAWELYDLSIDPSESRNLYDTRPEIADRMREQLDDTVNADEPPRLAAAN